MDKRILALLVIVSMIASALAFKASPGNTQSGMHDENVITPDGAHPPEATNEPGEGEPKAASSYDYVIITTNDIVANSQRLGNFVHLKEIEGHSVKVVTENDFDGLTGQAPNGRPEKIRQWLMDNYVAYGIEYVLLIGDPDPDNELDPNDPVGDIPMKMLWLEYDWVSDRDIPSDYFYADLTGDWDLDGDQLFGERLAVDNPKSPDPSIGEDTFSAEWRGKVMIDYDENYKFQTFSADGIELYIDGAKVIDNWANHPPTNDYTSPMPMTIGLHDIVLRLREDYGDAFMRLLWMTTDSDHVGNNIIPDTHLYDTSDVAGGLDATYYDNADFTGATVSRKDATVNFAWATGDRGPGGMDTVAEVVVGRIPVYDHNYTQLDGILGKTIDYESDPGDISWRTTALLAMRPLWDDTPTFSLGEAVKKNITDPAGFSSYRIYNEDYGVGPELTPITMDTVVGEWKNGYGYVLYDTHGSSQGASDIIDTSRTNQLDDSKPAIVYGAACTNGYPEDHNNLGYALLREGAIATLTATRVSIGQHGWWWSFNPASEINHNLAYFFTKRLITDGMSVGTAYYLTKGDVPQIGRNLLNYNVYGDPDLYLLVTAPNSPPVAKANGPYTANEGSTVTFDATGSSDPEGDPLEYRWDIGDDGTFDTGWTGSATTSYTWGDDYVGKVRLQVRDKLGLIGEDVADVNIVNVAPAIGNVEAYILVNFSLRAAGEKWHNVQMYVRADGSDIAYAEVVRYPGSPDDQMVKLGGVKCDVSKTLEVFVLYTPDDDPVNGQPNGATPVWVNISFEDGGYILLQHNFNVKHPDRWEWNIGVNQYFVGHEITFESEASDPGSDDLTFTWSWDDGTPDHSTIYFNDAVVGPDPYPSPDGTFPFSAFDTTTHAFASAGAYNVKLSVQDDDGGLTELLMVIIIA